MRIAIDHPRTLREFESLLTPTEFLAFSRYVYLHNEQPETASPDVLDALYDEWRHPARES